MHDFGSRVRELRTQRGWSQKYLADRVGVTHSAISLMESGDRRPSTETALSLAEALEIGVGELLGAPNPLAAAGVSEEDPHQVDQKVEILRRTRTAIIVQAQRLQDDLRIVKRTGSIGEFEVLLLTAKTAYNGWLSMLDSEVWGHEPGARPHPRVVHALGKVNDALNDVLAEAISKVEQDYLKLPEDARVIDLDAWRDTA